MAARLLFSQDAKPWKEKKMFPKRQLEILFVLVMLVFSMGRAWSDESVGLGWDPSPDPNVVGYLVYYGNVSGNYSSRINVGSNTLSTISGLQPGLTYYFVVSAFDVGGNESVLSNEAMFIAPVGDPPLLAPIASEVISLGQKLIVSNSVTDLNPDAGTITYSLDSGGPDGMFINPTNGALYWSPSFSQTGTTNQVTLRVTDSSVPPLSSTQTFTVTVPDAARLSLGNVVLTAGQTGVATLTLMATGPVTNLVFLLDAPTNLVATVTVQSLLPQILIINQQPPGAIHSLVTIQTINGQFLQGALDIATISFTTMAQRPSSFASLTVSSLNAAMADGQSFSAADSVSSQLAIVAGDSLLEAGSSNGNRILTLYGPPGGSYEIQSTTNLAPPCVWTPEFTTLLTNLSQALPGIPEDGSTKFYRARAL